MQHKRVHFVGIKGVGMTPLAIIAKEAGMTVTGSDIDDTFITDASLKKAGITPFIGFDPKNVVGVDLVITTGAHSGFENSEVIAARTQNIPVLTKGEAVGEFMRGEILGKVFRGICIAGTHGKTTTTAMIATILTDAGSDPSYTIGTGSVPSLPLPGHFGKGLYFVAESDEYATEPRYNKTPQFLHLHPQIAVITNIEHDHPDLYPTIDDVRQAFLQFAKRLPQNGVLITYGEDRQIQKMLEQYEGNVITYGFNERNTYCIKRMTFSGQHTFFWLSAKHSDLGEFMLKVTGEHNVLNAVAAVITCLEAGISLPAIKKALQTFTGSKRRLEYIGKLDSGAEVYDDYAHHPSEIKSTLKSLKTQHPKKKIVAIFQPHTYSRTKRLFHDFATSFADASQVIIMDIYASQREEPDPTISGEMLSQSIHSQYKDVIFLKNAERVIEYLSAKKYAQDTIVIFMGAGDIYKIIDQLPIDKS